MPERGTPPAGSRRGPRPTTDGPAQHDAGRPSGGAPAGRPEGERARLRQEPQPQAPTARPARRTRPKPRRNDRGELICLLCDILIDPDHPTRAYCDRHKREVRAKTYRKSRDKAAAYDAYVDLLVDGDGPSFRDGVHSGSRGIIVLADKVTELRAALGDLMSALVAARSVTDGFKPGNTAEFYRVQLVDLASAVEDMNEVFGRALRRPR